MKNLLIGACIGTAINPCMSYAGNENSPLQTYRCEMMTPGGVLPFILSYEDTTEYWDSAPVFSFVISNGDERIVIPQSETVGRTEHFGGNEGVLEVRSRRSRMDLRLRFDVYDSELSWHRWYGFQPTDSGIHAEGVWKKFRNENYVELPVVFIELDGSMEENQSSRFVPIPEELIEVNNDSAVTFEGQWAVQFESSNDLAIGTFTVDDNQLATGTFLTTTGDYRYLAGRVDGNIMRLSTFDGAHAFLFHARMQEDGTIEGDFWSGNWWHETWTAKRDDNAMLPDAFEQTIVTDESKLNELVFKDLDGNPTRVLDLFTETNAKARVIEIFGSWCPNCGDAARELVSLKKMYGDKLAVVGLAFELTEDFERSVNQVERHHEHIGSDWPILIAGLNDKDKATKTLGFLDQVRSYPTLVFLNEHNEVMSVYSGFSGPATGDAYSEQRTRFENLIDKLIEE